MSRRITALLLTYSLLFVVITDPANAAEAPIARLAQGLTPILSVTNGSSKAAELTADVTVPIDGSSQTINIQLQRLANGDYQFAATQQDYSFVLQRTSDRTLFAFPHHQVAFVSTGPEPEQDHLAATGILQRLVSQDSVASQYLPLVTVAESQVVATLLTSLLKLEYHEATGHWTRGTTKLELAENGSLSRIQGDGFSCDLLIELDSSSTTLTWSQPSDYEVVTIPRQELERQLVRGVRRAFEILAPAARLTSPKHESRVVANGELNWIEGHRVCVLSGTPHQIGTAHGKLLKEEALKTIDSVLYTFGTANTIRTGRWFRHDLEAAYKRLAPHIPDDHKSETNALAASLGIESQLAQTINVFPELFHCSGFAVFGSATKNGKLYHGRVLDYMTTIGLQDAATTFIVSVDNKIPFANVGYAGFIGSVTGMNAEAISLGEMGGRGEGQWDGVPMATLMRRALEECSTLQQVMTLWETSPRTCEYYYVFADGSTNQAVGVAATPESIEFIHPGQGHERLGEGIKDTVVLSAGSRLEKLRERVLEKHGNIDAETAIWLMSRPVAMKSNLHNALFVPQDGILYVANADHKHPAAERPYVRLDLNKLLESTKRPPAVSQKD